MDQPARVVERQGADQDGVHHAEHRRVGADPERERQHGRGGEAGGLGELAEGEVLGGAGAGC